jgi:hypothetical protein
MLLHKAIKDLKEHLVNKEDTTQVTHILMLDNMIMFLTWMINQEFQKLFHLMMEPTLYKQHRNIA